MADKQADLAGPGISTYEEVERIWSVIYEAGQMAKKDFKELDIDKYPAFPKDMYLLRTAHLGEVSTTVWPDALKAICRKKNIHVLQ